MSSQVEEQSPTPTSSVHVIPSQEPPQLFWDLEQRKDGIGWDHVAEMKNPSLEYQKAACFLSDEDKKKYLPFVFTTEGRLCKNYKTLQPFNKASRKFCIQRAEKARITRKARKARKARKNIAPFIDLTRKDNNQKTANANFTTSPASTSLALGYRSKSTRKHRTKTSDQTDAPVQSPGFDTFQKPTSQADDSTELILSPDQQKICAHCKSFDCCLNSHCRHHWSSKCCQCQERYHRRCERNFYMKDRKDRKLYDYITEKLKKPDWKCTKCLDPSKKPIKRWAESISPDASSSSDSNGKQYNSQLITRDAPRFKIGMQLEAVAGDLGQLDEYDRLSSDFVIPVLGSLSSSIDRLIRDVELAVKAKKGKPVPFEKLSILSKSKIQQHQQSHPLVLILRNIYGIDSDKKISLRARVDQLDETRVWAQKLFKLVVVYLLHHLVFSSSPFDRSETYIKAVDNLKNKTEPLGRGEKSFKLWMYRSSGDFRTQVRYESTAITQEMEKILSPLAESFGDEKLLRPGLENIVYGVAMFNARLKAESNTILTSWAATGTPYDDSLHQKVNNMHSDQVLYTRRIGVYTEIDNEIVPYAKANLEMYSREDRIGLSI